MARTTRWHRRVGLPLVVAALLAGPLLVTSAGAEGEARPPIWSSSAMASAVHVEFNSDPPLLPIEELINFHLPYGESNWSSSGTADALASAVYPGSSGTRGPALICEFAGQCPPGFPPPYPLNTEASHPATPDSASVDGAATAHADLEYVSTKAGASTLLSQLLGPLSVIATVNEVEAHTSQTFSDDGSVVTGEAVAHLTGIEMLDGVVKIEEMVVRSTSRSNGIEVLPETSEVVVLGVTVADQPATLGSNGLNLAGQGGGAEQRQQAEQQLSDALAAFGASIRLVGVVSEAAEGAATSSARGIEISFRLPVSGPALPGVPIPFPAEFPFPSDPNAFYRPYVGAITLGLAESGAAVSLGFGGGLGGLSDGGFGDLGAPTTPPPPPSGSTGSGTSFGPSFGTEPIGAGDSGVTDAPAVASPAAPTAGDSTTASDQDNVVQALDLEVLTLSEDAADRLADLYRGMAIAALIVFAASRLPRLLMRRGA